MDWGHLNKSVVEGKGADGGNVTEGVKSKALQDGQGVGFRVQPGWRGVGRGGREELRLDRKGDCCVLLSQERRKNHLAEKICVRAHLSFSYFKIQPDLSFYQFLLHPLLNT